MKKKLFSLMFALCVLSSPVVLADESKLDSIFNEEAIVNQLNELDPAVGYLVRLHMMKAHLKASLFTLQSGEHAEALQHVAHPRTEILDVLAPALIERGIQDLMPALQRAEDAYKTNNHEDAKVAVQAAIDTITRAEQLAGSEKSSIELVPDVIAALLRMAVVEYYEAFEYQTLKNTVEYHDGAFFVQEAKELLEKLAPVYKAKNAVAYEKMMTSLEALYKAWPQQTPPQNAILPVTKMQSLVSIAELQLNRLR